MTPYGAPVAVMDALDFTPAKFEQPKLLPPAPRKALPTPKRKAKVPRKIVKKQARAGRIHPFTPRVKTGAKGPLTCESCRQEFPRNRGYPAKRCPDCRAGKAPATTTRAVPAMATVTSPTLAAGSKVTMTPPRRCHECGTKTDENPCHSCKALWDRRK